MNGIVKPTLARLGGPAAVAALALATPAASHAASTGTWACSASAADITLLTSTPIDPVNSTTAPCADASSGVQSSSLATATGGVLTAGAVGANTATGTDAAGDSTYQASSSVADVSLPASSLSLPGLPATLPSLPAGLVTVPGTVGTEVDAVCVNGTPEFASKHATVPDIVVAGQTIPTSQTSTVLNPVTSGLSGLLGAVVTIKLNQETKTATADAVTGLEVQIKLGSTNILDAKLAESAVTLSSTPCASNASGSGTATNAGPGTITTTTTGATVSAGAKPNAPAGSNGATPIDYSWNWGDGSAAQDTGTNPSPSHTYKKPGTYTVTTTVRYSNGQVVTLKKTVTVGARWALPFVKGAFTVKGLQGTVDLARHSAIFLNKQHKVFGWVKDWVRGHNSSARRRFSLLVYVNGKLAGRGSVSTPNDRSTAYAVKVPGSVIFTHGTKVTVVGSYAPTRVKRSATGVIR